MLNLLENIRIVLLGTSHPGNIGSAARAIKTMGLTKLYLVNPKQFPDPQADALASGAVDILENAIVCQNIEEALTGTIYAVGLTARRRDLAHTVIDLPQCRQAILQRATRGEIAFVFGNETSGLSNDELAHCQQSITIPTNAEYGSLNLAATVQIVTYEMRQAALELGHQKQEAVRHHVAVGAKPATYEEIQGFLTHLETILYDLKYLNPKAPKRLMPRLTRLFARAELEQDEIHLLRGILTAVHHLDEKLKDNTK